MDEIVATADRVPPQIEAALEQADELFVVAPALNTRLHSLLSDVDKARHAADERLEAVADYLHCHGVDAPCEIGDEDPLQAIEDALAQFRADSLLVTMHADDAENWREHHVADHLQERFGLPATLVLVGADGSVRATAIAL